MKYLLLFVLNLLCVHFTWHFLFFFIIVNNHSHSLSLWSFISHLSWSFQAEDINLLFSWTEVITWHSLLLFFINFLVFLYLFWEWRLELDTVFNMCLYNKNQQHFTFLFSFFPWLIHWGFSFHRSLYFATLFKLILFMASRRASLVHFTKLGLKSPGQC